MTILVVDDNKYRHQWFRNNLDQVIDSAYSYHQACDLMGKHKYDAIYLDHDLGDFHDPDMVNGRELTGYDVVMWMIDHDVDCDKVVVHSVNPVGSQKMISTLQQYYPNVYRMPFRLSDRKTEG